MSLKERLDVAYQSMRAMMQGVTNGDQEDALSSSLAILVHTAYHLSEIRQALCSIKR